MGLREDFLAKFARLKAEADARNAALTAGRPAKVLTEAELAQGHPKVVSTADFQGVSYGVRLGTWFGWFWLVFTCVHGAFMFGAMAAGKVTMNGRLVSQAAWWHFVMLGLFYIPFFLVGFAFTLARYRITLSDAAVVVRWRILPYLGWTWKLAVGEEVMIKLAFRGSKQNKKPVESVVVASLGKEINFGAFLPDDVKEHLAALIQDYYGEPSSAGGAAPFLSDDVPGR
ncbi:MAG: hypothetical protein RI910_2220 [Verrucomicrobiota bacterium]|jgi:hypothetical protein